MHTITFSNRFLIPFLFCLLAHVALQGQDVQPEYLYANFDKPFYVAGEDIWFTVFFLEPSSHKSQIVYVALENREGDRVFAEKLAVFNGYCIGDISIPPDLPQGNYIFRAYTQWNLNFQPQAIYHKDIPIYSATLDVSNSSLSEIATDTLADSYSLRESKGLKINMEQQRFLPRENCELRFQLSDLSESTNGGYLSVSVLALPYAQKVEQNIFDRIGEQAERDRKLNPSSVQVPAESGLMQKFYLRHPTTLEPINSSFITGYVQESQQKFYVRAVDGEIDISLDNFQGNTVVQVFDANPFVIPYTPVVSRLTPKLEVIKETVPTGEIELGEAELSYIQEYTRQFQLNKVFGTVEQMRAPTSFFKAAFPDPSLSYKIDDYILFENMEEFLEEVIPLVKIRSIEGISPEEKKLRASGSNIKLKKKKRKGPVMPEDIDRAEINEPEELPLYFKVYISSREGLEKPRYYEADRPPVLLVNNYFTYNAEAVLNLDWDNVERIDVFNLREDLFQQFGHIGLFGVVAFYTRDGETPEEIRNSSNNRMVQGFYPARRFSPPSIDTESKIPNFSPLLEWAPSVFIGTEGQTTFSFNTNDRIGKFLIRAEGVTFDGKPVYAEELIEVAVDPK